MLKVSEISINSALVSWDSVAGATGYRVAWGPTPGKIQPASPPPPSVALEIRHGEPQGWWALGQVQLIKWSEQFRA